ncbi:MAG: hypothetical protein ABW252_18955 [Polyangiales bacterium]
MTKRFFMAPLCLVSLLVSCGSDATHEDTLELRAREHIGDGGAVMTEMPDASMDAGMRAATSSVADVCATLTYASTGAPFFAAYCAGCHQLPQPTFNELSEVRTFRSRIQARLFLSPTAPMPPPYVLKQPSAEEKGAIQQWLQCDPLD